MKILFLNMAGTALAKTTANNIKKRKTWNIDEDAIEVIDMIDCARLCQKDESFLQDEGFRAARRMLLGATKVMVGLHGQYYDNEWGYTEGEGTQVRSISVYKLGNLLRALLQGQDEMLWLDLALITCYSARALDYKKDFNNYLRNDHFDTFGFRLYRYLCENVSGMTIRMTARTGAVGTNDQGHTTVRTEGAVMATIEYNRLKEDFNRRYEKLSEKDKNDEQIMEALQMETMNMALEWQEKSTVRRIKYGKVVYEHQGGVYTITSRYPEPKVLYKGRFPGPSHEQPYVHCVKCPNVHGAWKSRVRLWHLCVRCHSVFCPGCGFWLKRNGWSMTRLCNQKDCGGSTILI